MDMPHPKVTLPGLPPEEYDGDDDDDDDGRTTLEGVGEEASKNRYGMSLDTSSHLRNCHESIYFCVD